MTFSAGQLATFVHGKLIGDSEAICNGAEIDTRRNINGKVFFALKGEQCDGHDFVKEAVNRGCCAVVVSKMVDVSVPSIIVDDPKQALYDLSLARRKYSHATVIAITGSVGKTTTKDLVACMLPPICIASQKNFNNELGVPLTLLNAEDADYVVVEVGANEVGEIEYLAKLVQPDVAILTSVSSTHLEGFGNVETILKEKMKLLQAVHPNGFVVIHDSVDTKDLEISVRCLTVGSSQDADITVQVDVDENGFGILCIDGNQCKCSLLGAHNAENAALGVVAVSELLNSQDVEYSLEELLTSMSSLHPPQGRLKTILHHDIHFIDDSYNANPASMRSALQVFDSISSGRKVLILGDMLELGEETHAEHRHLGHEINQTKTDVTILVGEAMRSACDCVPGAIYEPLASEEAINRIAALLHPNDTVLIKGSRDLRLERIIDSLTGIQVSES